MTDRTLEKLEAIINEQIRNADDEIKRTEASIVKQKLTEEQMARAREIRNEARRKHYKEHPEKQKEIEARYWLKKAGEL